MALDHGAVGARRQRPERVTALRARLHAWYRAMDAKFLRPHEGRVPWRPW